MPFERYGRKGKRSGTGMQKSQNVTICVQSGVFGEGILMYDARHTDVCQDENGRVCVKIYILAVGFRFRR